MSDFKRVGIKFSREGMTNYVSHLDMQRIFARALRRTGLQVKYSQGFNPHIVTSFAQALSVGMSTKGDYFEFSALDVPKDIASVLNEELPREIRALAGGEIPASCGKLMASVRQAEYVISPIRDEEDYFSALETLIDSDSFIATRKKDGKQFEVRPLVLDATITQGFARMRLSLMQDATLTPNVLRDIIEQISGKDIPVHVMRMDLFCKKSDKIVPLSALFCQ